MAFWPFTRVLRKMKCGSIPCVFIYSYHMNVRNNLTFESVLEKARCRMNIRIESEECRNEKPDVSRYYYYYYYFSLYIDINERQYKIIDSAFDIRNEEKSKHLGNSVLCNT